MEKFAYNLENMFQEKLLLFKELEKILEQEKNYIVDMDVDSLWKVTERKNQIALEIEQIREGILDLIEKNNITLNMGPKFLSLSYVINSLPFSAKLKLNLKKIKVQLDTVKEELTSLASENKRYADEYLSVINDIFSTITGSENQGQYTNSGRVLKDKTEKYLVRAEV